MRILIVEDQPDIADLVKAFLSKHGHEVWTAKTGSKAISEAIAHEFDLLVCDLMLPALQGTEIIRALKAQSPRLPVIVITALDGRDWEQPCRDAGASGSWDPIGAWGGPGGRVYATAINVLSLEIYYRYARVFR